MHPDAGGVRVRRRARVRPGVCLHRLLDEQPAGGGRTLLRHQADAAPGRVEVDGARVERPGHRGGRLGRVAHQTGQVDRGAHVDEEVGAAQDLGDRFWN